MAPIPANVQIKLTHAESDRATIIQQCVRQIKSPNETTLAEIGSYVGVLANNVRSALNYAIIDFADNYLQGVLSPSEFRKLRRQLDFPYTTKSKSDFDGKPLVRHIQAHFPPIYTFLEGYQPYYDPNVWISHLMHVSNTDKHVKINDVVAPPLAPFAVTMDGTRLDVFGDKVMVRPRIGQSMIYTTPCYIDLFRMFVSQDGNVVTFMITLDPDNPKPDLMHFIQNTPIQARKLISTFYTLF